MTTGFDSGLPSSRQLQNMIKDQKEVEIKLLTGETIGGRLRWQDQFCVGLIHEDERSTIIWRQAIAYLTPKE